MSGVVAIWKLAKPASPVLWIGLGSGVLAFAVLSFVNPDARFFSVFAMFVGGVCGGIVAGLRRVETLHVVPGFNMLLIRSALVTYLALVLVFGVFAGLNGLNWSYHGPAIAAGLLVLNVLLLGGRIEWFLVFYLWYGAMKLLEHMDVVAEWQHGAWASALISVVLLSTAYWQGTKAPSDRELRGVMSVGIPPLSTYPSWSLAAKIGWPLAVLGVFVLLLDLISDASVIADSLRYFVPMALVWVPAAVFAVDRRELIGWWVSGRDDTRVALGNRVIGRALALSAALVALCVLLSFVLFSGLEPGAVKPVLLGLALGWLFLALYTGALPFLQRHALEGAAGLFGLPVAALSVLVLASWDAPGWAIATLLMVSLMLAYSIGAQGVARSRFA